MPHGRFLSLIESLDEVRFTNDGSAVRREEIVIRHVAGIGSSAVAGRMGRGERPAPEGVDWDDAGLERKFGVNGQPGKRQVLRS
jgi:hypothetical protein